MAKNLGKALWIGGRSSEVSPTERWRCHLGRVEVPASPFAFPDSEQFPSGSSPAGKAPFLQEQPWQGWNELRTWRGRFSALCCSVLLPRALSCTPAGHQPAVPAGTKPFFVPFNPVLQFKPRVLTHPMGVRHRLFAPCLNKPPSLGMCPVEGNREELQCFNKSS